MNSLPEPFLQRLQNMYSDSVRGKILSGLAADRFTSFRVNTLLAKRERVLTDLTLDGLAPHPIEGLPDAFSVLPSDRRQLTESSSFRKGHIYIQNPSSMLPPFILDPQAGEKILDLCAAPGSKTLQMAALMEDKGWISAVEAVKTRFFRLQANIKKHGASLIHTYNRDGTKVWRYVPEQFDRVLLDVPCSSEGQFSLNAPHTFRFWSERKIAEMARKQKKLLFSAVKCLKPGGILVYSSCTFAPEENEAVIDAMLKKFSGVLEATPLSLPPSILVEHGLSAFGNKTYSPAAQNAVRILPDELFEGFFICRLQKRDK